MKLRDLTEKINEFERELAYGSETVIWGPYFAEYSDKIEDDEDLETTKLDIPDADAEIWLTAYAKMQEFEESGVDYTLDSLF